MSKNGRIKFAVIGCGHIGKRHAAMISNNKECELVALSDVLSRDQLEINHDVPFFNSIDELLDSKVPVDVLSIATPNGLHEEQALKGLRAGCHVVIEKPMALHKAGCERIIYEALHQSRNVFCVMQNRYSPPSLWLKDILRRKLLGRVFMVEINCYWNRDHRYYQKGGWHGTNELDGGTLFTQFSHFIDIMFWLFGDIENLNGKFRSFNHEGQTEFEDSGFVTFDFVNGGMGCINYSTSVWNENLESSITIIGENGTVKVGGQYMNVVELCNIKDYEMPQLPPVNPANDYGTYKGSAANHHYIFENVVDVLKGRAPITTNALEGLKVVEIIEKIYRLKMN
ncbi:Gfo/Idh/MocA family protein [Puia dinghuensis]|uniref:Oxidoreductase n=1 Tax=Puia dinghuensis TaxID=1792502 RepID=A0A8J2UF94_9BACT|nr:Gfo/Idh/MocA family oxidoreductase [Puia dinghuensis]GGB08643.1 oxidoreductase [Puia dinghuensis]